VMCTAVASILIGPSRARDEGPCPSASANGLRFPNLFWGRRLPTLAGQMGVCRGEEVQDAEFAIQHCPLEMQRLVTADAMLASESR